MSVGGRMDLHMSGLSLEDDEEGLSLHLEGQATNVTDQSLCLVGRFVTDRTIMRTHIMNERLAEVWRSVRGVTIKEVSPGLFIFQFFHKLDLEKVLKRGPWTFDNHLLVMARVHVGVPLICRAYHCFWWIFGFKFIIYPWAL